MPDEGNSSQEPEENGENDKGVDGKAGKHSESEVAHDQNRIEPNEHQSRCDQTEHSIRGEGYDELSDR